MITLDDILYNRKADPYSLRVLFNFLEENLATELLDFWLSALDVRNMFEPEHERSSYSMNNYEHSKVETPKVDTYRAHSISPSVRVQIENYAHSLNNLNSRHSEAQIMLRSTYVDDDSALCINISDKLRNRILELCPKTPDDPPVPGLFDEAMSECERLISTNYFKRFIELANKQNATLKKTHFVPTPPPRPRSGDILKGKTLSPEQIAMMVPKEPPPDY